MSAQTDFNTAVDGLRLNATQTQRVKDLGATLYRATLREEADHIDLHLNAMVSDNPTDEELAARVTILKTATTRIRTGTGDLTSEETIRG